MLVTLHQEYNTTAKISQKNLETKLESQNMNFIFANEMIWYSKYGVYEIHEIQECSEYKLPWTSLKFFSYSFHFENVPARSKENRHLCFLHILTLWPSTDRLHAPN